MQIIEIQALPNGAHRNQGGEFSVIPDGWAVIPDDMTIPDTYPFVDIEVEEITHYRDVEVIQGEEIAIVQEPYTVMAVMSMTAGIVPEPEPETESTPTLAERVATLEESNAEMTEALDMILSGVTE